jgi:hypothetical protein
MLARVNQAFEIYDIGDALPVYTMIYTDIYRQLKASYTRGLRPHTLVA